MKRKNPVSIWQNNETDFIYKDGKIKEIQKLTRGFESQMLFEYQNGELVGIEEIPKYFDPTSYEVTKTDKGYILNFEKEGSKLWYEIDTTLLKKCGGFTYGNLTFLNIMLELNITNSISDQKNEVYLSTWPDDEYYNIICKKDECENIILYSKQSKETLCIVELFEIKYTYNE